MSRGLFERTRRHPLRARREHARAGLPSSGRRSRQRQQTSTLPGVEEGVPVARVDDETEAEVVCGLLRSAGIECGHRATEEEDSLLENFGGGPREILVGKADVAAARALLADADARPAG
jgi:putative signal transducing protein